MAATLTQGQQDALLEIGGIGAGHAANALASLMQTKIMISTPTMSISKLSQLWAGRKGNAIVAVHMAVLGDAPGNFVVAFDRENARDLAVAFVKRVTRAESASEEDIDSTLQEFGNILAGSYLMALTSLTDLNMSLSEPTVLKGLTEDVRSRLPSVEPDRDIVIIESRFLSDDYLVPGEVILIPDETSIDSLLRPIFVKARVAI
jgi:chemotaxis protein CheC